MAMRLFIVGNTVFIGFTKEESLMIATSAAVQIYMQSDTSADQTYDHVNSF